MVAWVEAWRSTRHISMRKSAYGTTGDMAGAIEVKTVMKTSYARAIGFKWFPDIFVVWGVYDHWIPNGKNPEIHYNAFSGCCCSQARMVNFPNLWEDKFLIIMNDFHFLMSAHGLLFTMELEDILRLVSHAHASYSQ